MMCVVLELDLLGVKIYLSHAHQTEILEPLTDFFQNFRTAGALVVTKNRNRLHKKEFYSQRMKLSVFGPQNGGWANHKN